MVIDPEEIIRLLKGAASTLELTPPDRGGYLTRLLKCQSEWTCVKTLEMLAYETRRMWM